MEDIFWSNKLKFKIFVYEGSYQFLNPTCFFSSYMNEIFIIVIKIKKLVQNIQRILDQPRIERDRDNRF